MSSDGNMEFLTVIGPDAVFKGELSFKEGVRIQGTFEGKIETPGVLHIADGAHVNADIASGDLRVDGELKGNVTVSGKITLTQSARMEGDLRTNRIEMADGAVFVGNVSVGNVPAPAQVGENHRREQPAASQQPAAPAANRDNMSAKPRPAPDPSVINVPSVSMPLRNN